MLQWHELGDTELPRGVPEVGNAIFDETGIGFAGFSYIKTYLILFLIVSSNKVISWLTKDIFFLIDDNFALKFDGSNDYARVNDVAAFSNLSISFWIKSINGDATYDRIIGNDDLKQALITTYASHEEDDYLYRYGDVRENVEKGLFVSGLSHFLAFGMREGRNGYKYSLMCYQEV